MTLWPRSTAGLYLIVIRYRLCDLEEIISRFLGHLRLVIAHEEHAEEDTLSFISYLKSF